MLSRRFYFAVLGGAFLWLAGCEADHAGAQREEQASGYVEPERYQGRYTERQLHEAFRPEVPKMY